MKILKYILNIGVVCLVIYSVTVLFLLTNTECEDIHNAIKRSFYFQVEWFLILWVIISMLNVFLERKIEVENYGRRFLKLTLIHIGIFIITFALNAFVLYKSVCK